MKMFGGYYNKPNNQPLQVGGRHGKAKQNICMEAALDLVLATPGLVTVMVSFTPIIRLSYGCG